MSKLSGEDFRDSIAQLLRIKHQNVKLEERLSATTADILFVDDTNYIFPRTIAVEAKAWNKRLSSEDLATIFNLYAPSLTQREIDYLWIIGKYPLSGQPKISANLMNNVKYSSFDEFRASLMNFNSMMNNNILLFEHDDASKCFVDTRVRNADGTLFQYVSEWIKAKQAGLIVYGGYGLGKTTFSLYLANTLSKRYLAGEFNRIPIRIALGGMYSKQDLIALICSALSGGEGGVSVKDFSYGLFLEMNRQGQYLLILDGFDEMRHAMDLDDFVYTFEQMRPLFAGNAKVLILGRPDSFLTTQEEIEVLSALFDAGSEMERKLSTVEVAFFTKNEITWYPDKFLKNRAEKLTPGQLENLQRLMESLPDSEDSILSRPVQLKMFTKIIDECLNSSTPLNRYELYKRFIYSFIARESRKPARQPTEGSLGKRDLQDDRAKFMQAMAWWVLNGKKENRFLAEEIPTEMIPASFRIKRETTAAVREALVGSVIEPISQTGVLGSKARRYYYFPHKSYLEFLVANFFEANVFSIDTYRDFMKNVNSEILSFIEEGPQTGIDHLRQGLVHNLGNVDPRIVEVCTSDLNVKSEIRSEKRSNRHPSHIYTHYFYLKKHAQDPNSYLVARLGDSVTVESVLATYMCISNELALSGSRHLGRALILNCITGISIHKIRRYIEDGEPLQIYQMDVEAVRAAVLSRCVGRNADSRELTLSMENLSELIQLASRGSFFVNIPKSDKRQKRIKVRGDYLTEVVPGEWKPHIVKFVEKKNGSSSALSVRFAGDLANQFG